MKALALRIEKQTYCCACAEQLSTLSGYPALFFSMHKTIKVPEDRICSRCGHWYGSHDAQMSAERIADFLNGGTLEVE